MQQRHLQDMCLVGDERKVGYLQQEGTFLQKLETRAGLQGSPVSRLTMEDGAVYEIPSHLFERNSDGSWRLGMQLDELQKHRREGVESAASDSVSASQSAPAVDPSAGRGAPRQEVETFPVVEEQVSIETRTRETAKVRVRKEVREESVTIDEPSYHTTVDVKRVPIGKYVDGPIPDRTEGDILIVPVLEEVVVVEKRLLLKEELHITRKREEHRDPQSMTLLKEEVAIYRSDPDSSDQTSREQEINN